MKSQTLLLLAASIGGLALIANIKSSNPNLETSITMLDSIGDAIPESEAFNLYAGGSYNLKVAVKNMSVNGNTQSPASLGIRVTVGQNTWTKWDNGESLYDFDYGEELISSYPFMVDESQAEGSGEIKVEIVDASGSVVSTLKKGINYYSADVEPGADVDFGVYPYNVLVSNRYDDIHVLQAISYLGVGDDQMYAGYDEAECGNLFAAVAFDVAGFNGIDSYLSFYCADVIGNPKLVIQIVDAKSPVLPVNFENFSGLPLLQTGVSWEPVCNAGGWIGTSDISSLLEEIKEKYGSVSRVAFVIGPDVGCNGYIMFRTFDFDQNLAPVLHIGG